MITKYLIGLLFIIIIVCEIYGQKQEEFRFVAPKDWRSERIDFPLDFAPKLNYEGFEELRFAPGMFDPKSESYFTYTFFWWVKEQNITEQQLEKDLVNYFQGLTSAVGKSKGQDYDLSKVKAQVSSLVESKTKLPYKTKNYQAIVDTYDAFSSKSLLTLNMEITVFNCEKSKRTVSFFCVSPKPKNEAIWKQMQEIRDSFLCSN